MKMLPCIPALSRSVTVALLGLGAFSLTAIGCASTPSLTLTSLDHHQSYRQGFTEAYTDRDANGDVDVVLVDRATEETLHGKESTASVRQVMHIRILWAPTSDMKAVVSNASVKWYVIGRSNPQDVLQYAGIAFVSMDDNDGTVNFKVQNALLNPSGNHGEMNDPVGASRLSGTFAAHFDPQKVQKILAGLKTAVAAANSAAPVLSSVR